MDNIELLVLRKQARLLQYQLASLLGVSPVFLSQLETGRKKITPKMEKRIRKAVEQNHGHR